MPPSIGLSRLESLPTELLQQILDSCTKSTTAFTSYDFQHEAQFSLKQRNHSHSETAGLLSCLLTSRRLYSPAIRCHYAHIKIHQKQQFLSFMRTIDRTPVLGSYVRSLELSVIGAQMACNTEMTQYLRALGARLPGLVMLKLQLVGLEGEYPEGVVGVGCETSQQIWTSFPRLTHLELDCPVTQSRDVLNASMSIPPHDTSASLADLHDLKVLILRRNVPLTVPDLENLSSSARLQVLSLDVKQDDHLDDIAHLLRSHPALNSSVTHLTLTNTSSPSLSIASPITLTTLLTTLPPPLRSLDLSTFSLPAPTLPHLHHLLTTHPLSELRLGPGLSIPDLESIIIPRNWTYLPLPSPDSHSHSPASTPDKYTPTVITRRAVARANLLKRINSAAWTTGEGEGVCVKKKQKKTSLRFLGIANMDVRAQAEIGQSMLLAEELTNLEMIEVAGDVCSKGGLDGEVWRAAGWRMRCEIGAEGRAWLTR